MKYNYFDQEQRGHANKKYPFKADTLFYNEDKDCYYYPMGQQMKNIGTAQSKTKTGFIQNITRYQPTNWHGCTLVVSCHKSKGNRIIEVNHALKKYEQQVKQNLQSEKGIYHRKKRPADIEPVFPNIKNNHQFKRFLLRAIDKVEIETGLALAHIFAKK